MSNYWKDREASARQVFADHQAEHRVMGPDIEVLTFRKPGTGIDALRYRPSDECAPDNHWLIYGNALYRDLITKDESIGPWPKHITIGLPT